MRDPRTSTRRTRRWCEWSFRPTMHFSARGGEASSISAGRGCGCAGHVLTRDAAQAAVQAALPWLGEPKRSWSGVTGATGNIGRHLVLPKQFFSHGIHDVWIICSDASS
eukprot:2290536-Pleurochrysis_carterae.AAC.4